MPARAKDEAVTNLTPPARAKLPPSSMRATPARAKQTTAPKLPPPARAKVVPTPKTDPPAQANLHTAPTLVPPARADLDTIRALGGLLDDLELVRIMNGNRVGALEREHGEALPHLLDIQERVAAIEHLAHLELVRAWRKHPLAPWAKDYLGLGEKSIARLVAIIGDPAERPNVAKLWAYCGHGDARRKKAKGMSQDELFRLGNPRAKKQVWLISTSLLKAGNRVGYDEARAKYADALHEASCVRCGPAGKPALAGSPLSDGHKHARALRYAGKLFLRDLWAASRQTAVDDQTRIAGGDS